MELLISQGAAADIFKQISYVTLWIFQFLPCCLAKQMFEPSTTSGSSSPAFAWSSNGKTKCLCAIFCYQITQCVIKPKQCPNHWYSIIILTNSSSSAMLGQHWWCRADLYCFYHLLHKQCSNNLSKEDLNRWLLLNMTNPYFSVWDATRFKWLFC